MASVATEALIGIIEILVSAVLLWLAAKLLKAKKGFRTALVVAALTWLVEFVFLFGFSYLGFTALAQLGSFIAGIVAGLPLVRNSYKLKWGRGFIVWLVWFILSLIVGTLLIALAITALGITTAMMGPSLIQKMMT